MSAQKWPLLHGVAAKRKAGETLPDGVHEYGASVALPTGSSIRLALSSDVPIVNSLVNVTGNDVRVEAPSGVVRVKALLPALDLEYETRRRVSTMIADTSDEQARAKELVLSSLDADPTTTGSSSSSVQVFAPRKATGFRRPLPDIGECRGVLVRREVGEAFETLGSPYVIDEEHDDDDDEEDKRPAKRTRRERVPVYAVDDDDGSLVQFRVGL